MNIAIRNLTLVMTAVGTLAAQEKRANPFAGDAREAGLGKGIFRIRCAPCHGIRAQGGKGPDLTRGVYASGENDADLYKTIADGVPGTEMGAYGGGQSEDNIWRLVTYIRSTVNAGSPAAIAKGDAAKGERVYRKNGCGGCHAIRDEGGHSGPNLTRVGRQRSYAYLRDAVLDPGKDITPGYSTLVVTLNDGKKVTGVERGLDNFTAQLTALDGSFHSFEKERVRSFARAPGSLMPGGYGKSIAGEDLDDLLAYLLSLRGGSK